MDPVRSCLFCKIAEKEIPASIIFEDDAAAAFLDVHPQTLGHTIVIPKEHRETILDTPENELASVFGAVKKAVELIKRKLHPDGFTIGMNHGKAGGQVVPHLHIHIMPRWNGDGGSSVHGVVNNPPKQSIEEVLKILKG